MGIAYEMKELTRDIASSHKDRTKNIHDIGKEVKGTRLKARNMVHGFKGSRLEASRHLVTDLARDKTSRTSEVKDILKDSQGFLKDFAHSRNVTSTRLKKDLATGTAERQSEVVKTLEDVHRLIKGFHLYQQDVNYQLKEDLDKSRVKARAGVGKLLVDAQNLVNNLHTNRKEAGGELRKVLALNKADVELDVNQMRRVFREAQGNLRAELQEMRAAWQGLAGMIRGGNGGAAIPLKIEAPVTEKRNSSLEKKLLAAINGYPAGGISLAELSSILGVAPVVLGRASKGLIDKGKIRKQAKLYFPASSGN